MFIVDRKKDMIKTSGFQVWPREIEEALATHPAVAEVGVAGASDPVKGEVVHAWVVASRGPDAPPSRTCARTAANGSRPTKFRRASSSASRCRRRWSGKVLRRALKRRNQAAPIALTVTPAASRPGAEPGGEVLGAGRVAVDADGVDARGRRFEPSTAVTTFSIAIRIARDDHATAIVNDGARTLFADTSEPSGSYARSANASAATRKPGGATCLQDLRTRQPEENQ